MKTAIPTALSLAEIARRINLPDARLRAAARAGIIQPDILGPNHQQLFFQESIEEVRCAVLTADVEPGKVVAA